MGDYSQLESIVAIPQGKKGMYLLTTHDPPLKLPGTPLVEENWIVEEQINVKHCRNCKGKKEIEGYIKKVKTITMDTIGKTVRVLII